MVSASRRSQRKAHFDAPAHIKRKILSASLNKELRSEHGIRSLPIRKDDEVLIVRGSNKGSEGKVTQVYRKKWVIHVQQISRDKTNHATVPIGIHPSNVIITKLKLDADRKNIISRKTGKPVADADVEMKDN